jgi:hypothetical protein
MQRDRPARIQSSSPDVSFCDEPLDSRAAGRSARGGGGGGGRDSRTIGRSACGDGEYRTDGSPPLDDDGLRQASARGSGAERTWLGSRYIGRGAGRDVDGRYVSSA